MPKAIEILFLHQDLLEIGAQIYPGFMPNICGGQPLAVVYAGVCLVPQEWLA